MTAEAAAKLYVDAYAKDMFGYNYTGCYDIPFKDLESSNLLKEYADSSITCMGYDGNESYVYANKNGDKYDYSVRMVCIKKSDDSNEDPVVVYETSADEVRSCTGNTGKIEVKFEGITKNKWVKNADVWVLEKSGIKLYADSSTTIDNEIGVTIPKNGHASAKARKQTEDGIWIYVEYEGKDGWILAVKNGHSAYLAIEDVREGLEVANTVNLYEYPIDGSKVVGKVTSKDSIKTSYSYGVWLVWYYVEVKVG